MNEKITLCGDNCTECPRYNAQVALRTSNVHINWWNVRKNIMCKSVISAVNFHVRKLWTC